MGARLTGIDLAQEEMVTRFSRFIKEGEPLNEEEHGYVLVGANLLKNILRSPTQISLAFRSWTMST